MGVDRSALQTAGTLADAALSMANSANSSGATDPGAVVAINLLVSAVTQLASAVQSLGTAIAGIED